MTDKDELVALLNKWGVKYDLAEDGDVTVYGGYSGFYTEFEFDENGKFKLMGAWE